MEHKKVITLQGRKYDKWPEEDPSIIRIDSHIVLPEVQHVQYVVPVLAPSTVLGMSAADQVHDTAHGE